MPTSVNGAVHGMPNAFSYNDGATYQYITTACITRMPHRHDAQPPRVFLVSRESSSKNGSANWNIPNAMAT